MVIIALPAFNEEAALPTLLHAIREAMAENRLEYRVVIIDDGSKDGTARVTEAMHQEMPVTLIRHAAHRGLGESIRTGLLHALEDADDRDIIVTMDADNSHTPGLIARMVRGIHEGNDVIIASRHQPGANVKGVPRYRRVLSFFSMLVFRLLFPTRNVKDFTSGYRAYRAGILKQAFATYGDDFVAQRSFACVVDILLKLRRLDVLMSEVPLILRYDLKVGVSKGLVVRMIIDTLALIAYRRAGFFGTVKQLDPGVGDYFGRPGTVKRWWTPESGPLSFHYDAELQILDDQLEIDTGWRVLDVGTGRGRFGIYFARRGCRVVGVDVNEEMLEEARQAAEGLEGQGRLELRRAAAEDLSAFSTGEFDLVLCMELFDHLPDLDRALEEMRRVLKPEGRFVFTYVPSESAYGCLGNVYRSLQARSQGAETMISRTYSRGEVCRRLRAKGLELDRYWGIGLMCFNAQTRLFADGWLWRALASVARAEARINPYYEARLLARHGAHVVGMARVTED